MKLGSFVSSKSKHSSLSKFAHESVKKIFAVDTSHIAVHIGMQKTYPPFQPAPRRPIHIAKQMTLEVYAITLSMYLHVFERYLVA